MTDDRCRWRDLRCRCGSGEVMAVHPGRAPACERRRRHPHEARAGCSIEARRPTASGARGAGGIPTSLTMSAASKGEGQAVSDQLDADRIIVGLRILLARI